MANKKQEQTGGCDGKKETMLPMGKAPTPVELLDYFGRKKCKMHKGAIENKWWKVDFTTKFMLQGQCSPISAFLRGSGKRDAV